MVNDGAMLGGTGTIGTVTIADGGTVAPGHSIGTLNVSGNLTFADDSLFSVEVAPASADLLAVTGSAALAGTLDAVATGGTYTLGQRYTVLTAGGGVSGTFGAVTMQGDFSGFEADLLYESGNVILVLKRSGPTSTATSSMSDAIVFNAPTIVVERISEYETRIIGRLAGGGALFDETFDEAFDSATVQNAVQAARLAITSAGGPGVVVLVSDPVLVSRTVTSATTSTSLFSLADTVQSMTTTTTFGPATVTIADGRSCGAAIAALPSGSRPVCGEPGGDTLVVEPGTLNINSNTHTDYSDRRAADRHDHRNHFRDLGADRDRRPGRHRPRRRAVRHLRPGRTPAEPDRAGRCPRPVRRVRLHRNLGLESRLHRWRPRLGGGLWLPDARRCARRSPGRTARRLGNRRRPVP